jgi:hypothetical protein
MITYRFFTLILLASSILAIPNLLDNERSAVNVRAAASSSPKATAFSPAVLALASGFSANIADPQSTPNYLLPAKHLLTFVQKSIMIRENSQAIAPPGNPAIPGLAKVAMAQMKGSNLTTSLRIGGVNLPRDNKTVQTLIVEANIV